MLGVWQSVTKAIRKLDTLDMDEDIKTELIKDAEEYYSEQSRKFYNDCGIPYRRGYLFYGPPGTGKTSFSAALAGHLNCDVYHINLATGDISDSKLHSLFLSLPRKCIVVIEDIDSTGIGREMEALPPPMPPAPGIHQHPFPVAGKQHPRSNHVTLSGLLNAIDGNSSQEGRLLIMTSNNPDALDDALIRPGRIDKKVHFGYMNKHAAQGIFMRLIGRSSIAASKLTPEDAQKKAASFARKLPTNTFTPALVQNFLQACRGDSDKALAEIEGWAKENAPKQHVPKVNGVSNAPNAFSATVVPNGTALVNQLTGDNAVDLPGGDSHENAVEDVNIGDLIQ
jgi:chaperone BCS1